MNRMFTGLVKFVELRTGKINKIIVFKHEDKHDYPVKITWELVHEIRKTINFGDKLIKVDHYEVKK